MKASSLLAAGGLTGVLVLGACGGSGSTTSSGMTATTVTTAAAPPTTVATTAASATAPGPSEAAVTVKQFQFMPGELVVKAGTEVTWTNRDQILHTATSGATPGTADGKFDGPMDGVGQSFSFTFSQAGSFPYFCNRHNSMTGTIVVQ